MVQGISSNSSNFYQQQNFSTQLQAAGIPKDIISKGQSVIEEYEKENGISRQKSPQKPNTQPTQTKQESIFSENANSEAPDITSELVFSWYSG